jgi:hypothetical protein
MRLSKQQKVYLAILALVLMALVVDRTFLSRQSVTAEVSADSGLLPAPVFRQEDAGTDSPDPNSQPSSIKLAQRLEALWPDESLGLDEARDAFSLPAPWLAKVHAQVPLPEADAVAKFAKNHQLSAVLFDQTSFAVVDNHLLILGQELDGFKLVAVDEDSATFAAGKKQVVLRLENDR